MSLALQKFSKKKTLPSIPCLQISLDDPKITIFASSSASGWGVKAGIIVESPECPEVGDTLLLVDFFVPRPGICLENR